MTTRAPDQFPTRLSTDPPQHETGLDDANRSLRVSAGHPVPLLARPHRVGAVPLATVMYLLWGEYGDAPCTDRMLEAGDRLALYTGGITDRTEPRDTMEDSDRLHAALARTSSASPAQIVDALTAELDAFADVQEADDDQTLVVVGID